FKSPMWITPLPPSLTALGEGSHGSILNGNYVPNRLSSAWKPTVKDAIFIGGQIKVVVRLGDDNIVECRCNPRSGPWKTGSEVSVRINPDNLPAVVPSTKAGNQRI
ncbi:TOBE domain-containing protein, partial [Corticibacterium sp. UT-5YL-CI-8]|nr:TOBE domain-containing protein [Tianweitania sp. UT-5YL-CI-8]